MPEEMETPIREMPRDAEVIELLKNFPTRGRFPRDKCNYGVRNMAARQTLSKIAVLLSAA